MRCVLSYLHSRAFPVPAPKNFEDWVSNQFGRRLFGIFFKTYTEKVWGMDCKDISADWAAQRIKGLSLGKALAHALLPQKPSSRKAVVKTLINSFRYPRRGPGMMWEAAARKTREMGGQILMDQKVVGLDYNAQAERWTVHCQDDADYAIHVETIRRELEARFPTLHLMGRNGMHKYNNQDHAMMTAMLTVENILAGTRAYDVWNVNGDAEYHEGQADSTNDTSTESRANEGLRAIPARVRP